MLYACLCVPARACAAVRAHTCATCLPALHALLLSLLLRWRHEREGVCIPKKIILPSRPSSAAFRLHPPLPVHLAPPTPRRCEMCARSLKEGSQQHGGLSPLINQNIASRDPVSSRNGAVAHKAFTLSAYCTPRECVNESNRTVFVSDVDRRINRGDGGGEPFNDINSFHSQISPGSATPTEDAVYPHPSQITLPLIH